MATVESSDTVATPDPDPVIARYNVFLKPQLPAHQKLLVLQYPNRTDKNAAGSGAGATSLSGQTPTELRIKTASGMVEVDVPLDYASAYDRAKGIAWGTALATSTKAKAGGSHGLAGGFGVGGTTQGNNRHGPGGSGGGSRGAAAASAQAAAATHAAAEAEGGPSAGAGAGAGTTSSADWAEAVRQDRVLRLQTLGGMCPPARIAEARWMIGAFDGGNLHLTPVNSLVHLRPQMHHIDAEAEVERAKHRDTNAAAGAGGGEGGTGVGGAGGAGSAGAGGAGGRAAGAAGARAIHMTVKSAGADGDEVITETMADRLRAVQMENWARMLYVGDDDETSWEVYDQTLFLKDPAAAMQAATAVAATTTATESGADDVGGKGKDIVTDAAHGQLVDKVPALLTNWTEDDMLQAISRIEKPPDDLTPTPTASMAKSKTAVKGKGPALPLPTAVGGIEIKSEADAQSTSPNAQRRTRPLARSAASKAAAAAPATTSRARGARARQAGRGVAMDVDQ
ncbi:DNA-directed RNA polymerase III subunit RPC5 [Sporothrix schenckii 1099-18]|uniref:DNA-directed RNA polymerase III subunit RPC5 n=1 Tax=Sporothrix schenckii 1099-18 TaxID=1397361 RepID=A0A0F2M3Q7_SPOSC|nr:DNA-directed RNA polymerase III subunit RPC5 [Sporothrix schenckii 1099-18]KJR84333.1 DNA-directed RNA polymerase III subunit RPC5 [Sporothrix schenckii 1099-18]